MTEEQKDDMKAWAVLTIVALIVGGALWNAITCWNLPAVYAPVHCFAR